MLVVVWYPFYVKTKKEEIPRLSLMPLLTKTTFEKKSMAKAYSNILVIFSFLKRTICAARDTGCA